MARNAHRGKTSTRSGNARSLAVLNGAVASGETPIRKKVAIIGSGCAGWGAAYALRHSDYEVHIFEKDSRLGGHTNTQIWKKDGRSTPVDTGFIVMNSATYPNFINFLDDIGVDTKPTEMSFGVTRDNGAFEWSGSLTGIFAQRRNFFRLRHWRMILDIVRFNQYALDLLNLDDDRFRDITIGQYLDREGYSQAFKDDYLIPMTAAVWSTSPDKATLEFPAQTLIRFMWNHHLLSTVARRPDWLTIPGGSQQYVKSIIKSFPKDRLHLHRSCKVIGLSRQSRDNSLTENSSRIYWQRSDLPGGDTHSNYTGDGLVHDEDFDQIVFACHGDQVLPILTGTVDPAQISKHTPDKLPHQRISANIDASYEEHEILSCFQTTKNECYLHSDLSLMPKRRDTWSSWNYLINSQPSQKSHPAGVSLTYNMNILQHISSKSFGDVLVTMNPDHAPRSDMTQGHFTYEHPLYTVEAVRAQERLESIQNKSGVSFCGAWTKYGFHEDGFSSGIKVAVEHLGASLPFEFVDSTYSRGQKPETLLLDHVVKLVLAIVLLMVRLGELVVRLPGVSLCFTIVTFLPSLVLDTLERKAILA